MPLDFLPRVSHFPGLPVSRLFPTQRLVACTGVSLKLASEAAFLLLSGVSQDSVWKPETDHVQLCLLLLVHYSRFFSFLWFGSPDDLYSVFTTNQNLTCHKCITEFTCSCFSHSQNSSFQPVAFVTGSTAPMGASELLNYFVSVTLNAEQFLKLN